MASRLQSPEAAAGACTHYEGVGFSPQVGWYNAAVMNAVVAAIVISMHLLTDWLPPHLEIVGYVTAVLAPIWLLGARFLPEAQWAAHIRILTAMGCVLAAALLVDEMLSAIALMVLLPLAAVSFLLSPRLAIPYNALGLLITAPLLAIEAPTAAAVSTTAVLAATSIALVLAQHRLRRIAAINNELAVRDPLTGLANLRSLRSRVERESARAGRDGATPYLFTLDLDDFKLVNDRFSHSVGDAVLRETATELAAELTPADLLVRRGGDEFAVFCPSLAGRDPQNLRQRLEEAVARARRRVCPEVNPRGSVAFVRMRGGEDVAALFARADRALHEAKLEAHPERREDRLPISLGGGAGFARGGRRLRVARAADVGGIDHRAAQDRGATARELELTRIAQRALSSRTNWLIAGAMNLTLGALIGLLTLTGFAGVRSAALASLALAALAGSSLVWFSAARRALAGVWLPCAALAAVVTLSVAMAGLGGDRWVAADLFLIPILFAAFTLSPRRALPTILAGYAAFFATLATSDYAYVPLRSVFTFCVVAAVGSMLIKARKQTWNFTKRAVEASSLDPLTGAANLRGLRARVAEEIERCAASDTSLAILSIDLDDFKSVNDRYSHTTGEEVLLAVTRAIDGQTRIGDLVARRGGDEFSIVVALDDRTDAYELAQRVAAAIAEARIAICPDVSPTAGIGTVFWREGESLEAFLRRCDDELHEAKLRSREGEPARLEC